MYRDSIASYKKVYKQGEIKKPKTMEYLSYKYILIYLSAFFSSRVVLMDNLMPFGAAFCIATFGILGSEAAVMVGISAAAGYLTLFTGYLSISHFIVCVLLLASIMFITKRDNKRIFKMMIIGFTANFSVNTIFYLKFIPDGAVPFNYFISFFESIMIAAASYVFMYGIPAYLQNKKRKIYSKEEIICLSFIAAIIISGMWDINHQYISIRNIAALFIIMYTGYIEGASIGAASGVAFGVISGLSYYKNPTFIGIFGLCGLMCGVFKNLGKFTTALVAVFSGGLLSLYVTGTGLPDRIVYDIAIAALVFLVVPRKKYESISFLTDSDRMELKLQQSYIERVRDIISKKLNGVSTSLIGFSELLEKNIQNELSRKIEIDGMVEKLAGKACFSCEYRDRCWNKDFYSTYNQFVEVLRYIEKRGRISVDEIPDGLNRKCIRPNELLRQANSIFEVFRLNNEWRKRLLNSRIIVSEQIRGVSGIVNSMMEEVASTVEFRNDIEEEIAATIDRQGLDFNDVLALKNSRGRYEVTIYRKPCFGRQICSKEYGETISKILNVKMVKDGASCKFNAENTLCQFRFIEAENYKMVSAVARESKEDISGDSYSFGEIEDGRYLTALSDGMGSGSQAASESETTVSMLERFLGVGFDRGTVIKAINSVLVLRACEESYATIDMGLVDLYNGIGEFIKIGSAPTFIKSGNEIYTLKSATLPVGILNEVDMESEIVQLKNGDIIVMVTDGVVDADNNMKEKWIERALIEFNNGNPREIADYILKCAAQKYGNDVKDDMTVVVSKIWKVV